MKTKLTPRQLGAWKSAARTLGMSYEAYASERDRGNRWCYACSSFQHESFFRLNASKPNGHADECNSCHQEQKRGAQGMRVFTVKGAIL